MQFTQQHKDMPFSEPFSYVAVFLGGVLGALTFSENTPSPTLSAINWTDILEFTLRSIIGGAIALCVKVAADWIVCKYKSKNKKNG
jgi:hypothetical protein